MSDSYMEMVQETWTGGPGGAPHSDPVLYAMVGLAGEAGEIANLAQKVMRDGWDASKRQRLLVEMGGVFWFLYALCWRLGISPAEVQALNETKLRSRLERGALRGSGDDR